MSVEATPLAGQLLIALPALADPNFARSLVLVCQHDGGGAMGVVVNRASEYSLGDVFGQMGIGCDDAVLRGQPVLAGGPVHPERGFVLHDGDGHWDSSLQVGPALHVTTSRDVLEAIARGDGPERVVVALGCAGWGAGQLDHELTENSWQIGRASCRARAGRAVGAETLESTNDTEPTPQDHTPQPA